MNLVVIIYLWLLLVSFFVGLAISVVALYAAWGMGPKLQRNNVLCCLVVVFTTFFWVVMLSQLFETIVANATNKSQRQTDTKIADNIVHQIRIHIRTAPCSRTAQLLASHGAALTFHTY